MNGEQERHKKITLIQEYHNENGGYPLWMHMSKTNNYGLPQHVFLQANRILTSPTKAHATN